MIEATLTAITLMALSFFLCRWASGNFNPEVSKHDDA